MKFREYINEKYWKRIDNVEVFINPSWKELMEISNKGKDNIRFSAYCDKKEVYVWNAILLLHQEVEDKTGYEHYDDNENLIAGIAKKKGNIFEMHRSDQLEDIGNNMLKSIINKNWNWIKKNKIDINNFVNRINTQRFV